MWQSNTSAERVEAWQQVATAIVGKHQGRSVGGGVECHQGMYLVMVHPSPALDLEHSLDDLGKHRKLQRLAGKIMCRLAGEKTIAPGDCNQLICPFLFLSFFSPTQEEDS